MHEHHGSALQDNNTGTVINHSDSLDHLPELAGENDGIHSQGYSAQDCMAREYSGPPLPSDIATENTCQSLPSDPDTANSAGSLAASSDSPASCNSMGSGQTDADGYGSDHLPAGSGWLSPVAGSWYPEAHHFNESDDAFYARRAGHDSPEERSLALKARLLATLGWRMASSGAETRLISHSVKKMAHDLGCTSIDMSLTRNGIIVKLRKGRLVSVEFMEIKHFAINMDSVSRLNTVCHDVSSGRLTDHERILLAIRAVRPRHYDHNLLIVLEAIAGACFAGLNGGNTAICLSALIGGLFLMYARFSFIKKGFFESFTFMLAAFTGSLTAALCAQYIFNLEHSQVILAASATTLLLVPGFPLINGFLDIFKGYVPIGMTRLSIAMVLVISASIGLVATLYTMDFITSLIPPLPRS